MVEIFFSATINSIGNAIFTDIVKSLATTVARVLRIERKVLKLRQKV